MSLLKLSAVCIAMASAVSGLHNYPKREPRLQVPPEGCTAIVVDPEASIDGGMTTHTNDCKNCDFRMGRVPARDWPEGSKRAITRVRLNYPVYVGDDRGETYKYKNLDTTPYPWKETEPIGYIPQVAHTYSYINGLYGIENEHQVAMGESTCAARLVALPVFDGGKALFDMSELSRVAMERTKTAREAVLLMGKLAEKYGFYGAEWKGSLAEGEAGEAMVVADPKESYVFHILPDHTGTSAVWVAQKVPKGHIAVVSNAFMIGDIDFDDHENFLYSQNIKDVAQAKDFWQPEYGPFNFQAVYGETVFYEIYCSRRTWRILSLAAPSLKLNYNLTVADLPFSVAVEKKLSKFDLMQYQRDHYENTPFDLTKGLQSGPYGNPNRYDRGPGGGLTIPLLMQGTFERGISLYRTVFSFVTTSRSWVPNELAVVWWGPAAPHATFYSPLYANSHILPDAYTHGSLFKFDRTTAWWASTSIGGWMERMYCHISIDVYAAQKELEQRQSDEAAEIEKKAANLLDKKDKDAAYDLITDYQNENGKKATAAWWGLFEHLVEKFHDGYRVDDFHAETIAPVSVFYPMEWLNAVGFFPHPPDFNKTTWLYTMPVPSHAPRNQTGGKPNQDILPPRDVLGLDPEDKQVQKSNDQLQKAEAAQDAEKPNNFAEINTANVQPWSFANWMFLVIGLVGGGIALGVVIGHKVAMKNNEYTPIPIHE